MRDLRRLWRYIAPYKIIFILAMLLLLATVGFNAALPYVSGLPTSEIAKNISHGEKLNFPYIFRCLIWIFFVGLGYSICQLGTGFCMTHVVQEAMSDLRRDLTHKINLLPVAYFDQHPQGDLLSRVTNDIDALSNALQQSFTAIVNAVLSIAFAVLMMFYISPKIALFAIIMIPASLVISRIIVKISQPYFKQQQYFLGRLNGYVQENMTGFGVLKAFGREKETLAGFKKVNQELYRYGFKAAFISGLMSPLVNLTAYSAYIGVAVLGCFSVIGGTMLVGQVQAFVQYVWQVSQPMGQITQLSAVLQSASASIRRIFEILDEAPEKEIEQEEQLPEPVKGAIHFDHVSFSYDPDEPLIEDLNVKVAPGQTVAIVGPTGAGKTTLINLLMRFYDPDKGAIRIDGVAAKHCKRKTIRALFGMVLQDAWLYNDTIMENIRFGNQNASDYEVVDAAKTANVDHFIRTMPDGYEMRLNEESTNISLGQKQLITIARAIIADPKILILDEATSSVDTRLEELIQEAMDKVMEGRTSFVIAHRLSTIKNADLILVMNHGHIIEQGTHTGLLEKDGFYAQLYNSQFQET